MLAPGTKGVKTEAELSRMLLDEGLTQPPCPCLSGPSSLPVPTAAYRAATWFPNTMNFLLQSQSSCSGIKKSPLDSALIQSQGRCAAPPSPGRVTTEHSGFPLRPSLQP